MTALQKLKAAQSLQSPTPMTVYRGIKRNVRRENPDQYDTDAMLIWWSPSSATEKMHVLTSPRFVGTEGERTIFTIETSKAVRISMFSAIQEEEEVLLPPGTALVVKSHANFGAGLTMVQMCDDPDAPELIV